MKNNICIDWTPNTNHTGLYVAEERVVFKDAGIEIEIVQPEDAAKKYWLGSGKAIMKFALLPGQHDA